MPATYLGTLIKWPEQKKTSVNDSELPPYKNLKFLPLKKTWNKQQIIIGRAQQHMN